MRAVLLLLALASCGRAVPVTAAPARASGALWCFGAELPGDRAGVVCASRLADCHRALAAASRYGASVAGVRALSPCHLRDVGP